jgi:hypothetical protein
MTNRKKRSDAMSPEAYELCCGWWCEAGSSRFESNKQGEIDGKMETHASTMKFYIFKILHVNILLL